MKKLLLLLFVGFSFSGIAQKNSPLISYTEDSLFKKSSVLVIPFETKLYMSQIDKQLSQRSGLNYDQLVESMRKLLVDVVAFKVNETMKSYRLYWPGNDSIEKELHYTYTSINYNYRALPEAIQKDPTKTDSSKIKLPKILSKKDKEEERKEGGARIENGQIISEESNVEKFMDVDLLNLTLLDELSTLYNSNWFIFLNQLDLLYSSDTPSQIRIKVHYTIFDINTKKQYAGAAITFMPDYINDLKEIKDTYFFKLATEINNQFNRQVKLFYNPK